LEQELKTGKGFSSYGAIVEWLKQEYGLEIEYATVYALVRYKLGLLESSQLYPLNGLGKIFGFMVQLNH
jgi:hypothetical protein